MLSKSLIINALFSLVSGLIILSQKASLAVHLPMPDWIWLVIGIGLIGFALELITLAINKGWARRFIGLVIISDISWVVVTSFCLLLFISEISNQGIVIVSLVNVVVAGLVWFQYKGYQSLAQT